MGGEAGSRGEEDDGALQLAAIELPLDLQWNLRNGREKKADRSKVRRGVGMRGRYERGEMQIQMGNARRGNMRDRAAVRW